MLTVEEFSKHLDLAYLAPNLQRKDIIEACNIAKKYNLANVNVNSCWAELVVNELKGTSVGPSAVIGFPYGACISEVKYLELQRMVDLGCCACDMVINIGAVKDANWDLVREEIKQFVKICGNKCKTKLIFEVAFLNDEEIAKLTKISCEEKIDYVKTATGSQEFPNFKHVEIMRQNLSGHTKIKVSGVPRTFTLAAVLFMINEMGVELCGTRSAGLLVEEYTQYLMTYKK